MMDTGNIATTPKSVWKEERWSVTMPFLKLRAWYTRTWKKHPIVMSSALVVLLLTIYAERCVYQPLALDIRIYSGGVLILLVVAAVFVWFFRGAKPRTKLVLSVISSMILAGVIIFGPDVHRYLAEYLRYQTMSLAELPQLPTTAFERVHPLYGIHRLAVDRTTEATKMPTMPDLVRTGKNGYDWTMAIEPSNFTGKIFGSVDGMLRISASDPTPDLSRTPPEKVYFSVGEDMYLSHNINTCVRRAFGLWRFLNYEPGNVFYIKDDSGAWVTAVSLVKWTGLFFPWPEFGGVQIIEQGSSTIPGRVYVGCGHFIPADEVANYKFLRGQNIVPYVVTQFMAKSLRFQGGFTAPMWWNHEGDVRVADLPSDMNQQPFSLYFDVNGEGKLYQYFALEPADQKKKGLAVSFFAPADGIGSLYIYRHDKHNESACGVTAVEGYLKASKRQYDWSENRAVENRPYIRDIADANGIVARRMFWLTTVVTTSGKHEEGEPLSFVSGGVPEIALTDVNKCEVVWVDSRRPDTWQETLRTELGNSWAKQQ